MWHMTVLSVPGSVGWVRLGRNRRTGAGPPNGTWRRNAVAENAAG